MIIAVNTRLNKEAQPEGYEEFLFSMLNNLCNKFPANKFLYIFDRPYDASFLFPKNVLPIIAGPKTNTSLSLRFWFNYKIPVILRNHKADVFVSFEGICSLRTKIPQCLFVSDVGFLQSLQSKKKLEAKFHKK